MDKALKVLIVLLLLLSVGALMLEIRLFGQREELKGRNILLTRNTIQLADTIEVPPGTNSDLVTRDLPRIKLTDEQLKPFYQVDTMGKPVKDPASGKKLFTGPGTLDSVLVDLTGKAVLQLNRLNDTRVNLEQTRTDLSQTKDTLKTTEDNLLAARKDIKEKTETIATQKADIEQKTENIAKLTEDKTALETKVEEQTTEISKLGDKLSDRESQLEATKRYVEKLQKDLARALRGTSESETNDLPPGLYGQVLVVNSNWNFVVLDLLPDSALTPMTDLTIQRDSVLVGKLRISEVIRERNFAIGEVLADWQQTPIAKGDYVFR
jgi:hypothetical protein